MESKTHVISLVVEDRETAHKPVTDLLHLFASHIKLRVGYPIQDKAVSVIFLVIDLSNDELGAFTGKLGRIPNVKVKSMTLKIEPPPNI